MNMYPSFYKHVCRFHKLVGFACPSWDEFDGTAMVLPSHHPATSQHSISNTQSHRLQTSDTGLNSKEMGMTQEKQREIQASLFKMLGHST